MSISGSLLYPGVSVAELQENRSTRGGAEGPIELLADALNLRSGWLW